MKFIRNLPLMWARTLWPFSSSAANIVLGRGSITVPSTSIASFLATVAKRSLSRIECRSGTGTRTCRVSNGAVSGKRRSADAGQDFGPVLGDRDRVFEVRGEGPIPGHDRPAIGLDFDLFAAQGEHGPDCQAHAGLEQPPAIAARPEVGHLRVFMHACADPVPDELPHHAVVGRRGDVLD